MRNAQVIALLACATLAALPKMPCKFIATDESGKRWGYDLTSLYHESGHGEDMSSVATSDGSTFYVNLCGESYYCPGNAVCERDEYFVPHAAGATETQSFAAFSAVDASRGVAVSYTHGEACNYSDVVGTRTSVVRVACMQDAASPYIAVVEDENCTSTITIFSDAGCGSELAPDLSSESEADVTCKHVSRDPVTGQLWAFDLTPLHHNASVEDLSFTDSLGNTYTLNLCGETLSCSHSSVCMKDEYFVLHSAGTLISQNITDFPVESISQGVNVTYKGEECWEGQFMETAVELHCSPLADPAWIYEAVPGNCTLLLRVMSAAACGTAVNASSESSAEASETASSSSGSVEVPCTYEETDPATGIVWKYDLCALRGTEVSYVDSKTGSTWYVSPFGETLRCAGSSVCEYDEYMVAKTHGYTNTQFMTSGNETGKGVVVGYTGDECWEDGPHDVTYVYIGCSTIADEPFIGVLDAENCSTHITVWSQLACGTPSNASTSSSAQEVPSSSSETPVPPPASESSGASYVVENSSSSVVPEEKDNGRSGFWFWWIILLVVVAVAALGVVGFFLYKKVLKPRFGGRSGYVAINTGRATDAV